MGPRSFKRGNEILGFIIDSASIVLQWGHVLSNVETVSRETAWDLVGGASMGPRSFKRGNRLPLYLTEHSIQGFNGATFFQTWKPTYLRNASSPGKSFNGATFFQTWKPKSRSQSGQPVRCFNGATFFQTWKPIVLHAICGRLWRLQWGHVLSNEETVTTVVTSHTTTVRSCRRCT